MLERTRTLLFVTDVQGKLAATMDGRETLYRNLGIIIDGCRILDIPILWLEQYPAGLGPTVTDVATHLQGLTPYPKRVFSALDDPAIDAAFTDSGRDQVLLTGIETHVCIYQTTMDMLKRGIEVQVVVDAVSSRTTVNKQIGLERIGQEGGRITSVEMALFELVGAAEGDEFKRILHLVK